ncbi:MAG TPA: threonylcarbamoyl-AMP synthase [Candidatus Acutalibacter pullistercoris]|uniref:Dephospho-CoA kinase n=1 Tax=Candidatus Acutalibacter pullistercoris TaxID=2838418 RepID=A0A9D2C0G2_9FIRM|nr:threonylcarbamoyl-AMP synthase [Candidatus Acutalibacter pullistercoris]
MTTMDRLEKHTILLRGDSPQDVKTAGEILRRGGLVAIPTETVYGLAANALDGAAVKAIYQAKGRPSDNPLIVHICDLSQLPPLVRQLPESAKKLAAAFWPGPLTIILKKSDLVPRETSGGLDTVAVRFPAHPVAQAVIREAGLPLAAPSANLSGKPSPTTFAHVREDLTGRVDALLDGGDCAVGVESTVLTLAEGTPRVLRPGGVTVGQLREVLGEVEVDPAVVHRLEEGAKAASPGMKYKHYAPQANVVILDASPEDYRNYVNQQPEAFALCYDEDGDRLTVPFVSYGSRYDHEKQAHMLFTSLHHLDEIGARTVFARMPQKRGVGLAVYNRLIRAAGFQILRPRKALTVGLVGPTGAGKSTVGKLLQQRGCAVIDCDALTRDPQVYDGDCLKELQAAFGADVAAGGVLDRALLARRAFATPEGRKVLGDITFPRIARRLLELRRQAEDQGALAVVLDAPTLFEAGLDDSCARILAVTAPEEVRLERIRKRDGLSEEAARLRMGAQKPESFYTQRADSVVDTREGRGLEALVAPLLEDWLPGEEERCL